jgi:hypothetical protein
VVFFGISSVEPWDSAASVSDTERFHKDGGGGGLKINIQNVT